MSVNHETQMELNQFWNALLAKTPRLRIRDAANELNVSEAELLASQMVVDNPKCLVTRLEGDFRNLMRDLKSLGKVMALTRNDAMVHEKTGVYKDVTVHGQMGLALGVIDLRMFFNQFAYGFAVTEESSVSVRYSLQFFDHYGDAVHKIYATNSTDMAAYGALADRYRAAQQSPVLSITTLDDDDDQNNLLTAPDELDIQQLRDDWQALKDVHHFQAMLKQHGIGRVPAYRAIGTDYALPMAASAFESALLLAAEHELPIMVFVGNRGMIQIHTGPVISLKRTGPWFNVLDGGFNLHANTDRIDQAWLVRKPTVDGVITSLEMYDAAGQQQALMFGERENGQPESPGWRTLLDQLIQQHGIGSPETPEPALAEKVSA